MSYIGQGLPADTFQGFTTDKFTGDGTANKTFTLTKEPFSEDTILVTIDGVIQEPTDDFTVSGTTLTLVGTAANNSEINVTHMGGPLPIGGASELDLNGASDKLILDADADTTISADTDDQIDFKAGGTDIFQLTATTATFNDNVSINIDDNTDGLTITSTDADATNGPGLRLFRNSASPADGDDIGRIIFSGENDASEQINYGIIRGDLLDVTDGTEDGVIKYETIFAGTNREMMRMGNGEGVIINEDGIDMDFRVESDTETHAFFVEGSTNRVGLRTSSPQDELHVNDSGSAAVRVSGGDNNNKKAQMGYDTSDGPYIKGGSSGIATFKIFVDNTTLAMTVAQNGVMSGDFNDTSDVALKENIVDLESATEKLKQLKARTFDWKQSDKGKEVAGFIAQEVESIIPSAVVGDNYVEATYYTESDDLPENTRIGDTKVSGNSGKAINTSAILAYAVKTIQELEARIATLEGN